MVHYYGQYRPDALFIMGTRFKVEWFVEMDPMGEIDFRTCSIRMSKDMEPTLAVDTLIHEAIHAIWYFADLGKKAGEEKAVSVVSSGLNALFASNRNLVKWIQEVHAKE